MFSKWNLRKEDKKIWKVFGGSILISFILAIIVVLLDTRVIPLLGILPDWTLTNVSTAKEVLTTLASTMFTVTTFTFTAMLTLITLYTSNFSPRAVENFLLDTTSMRTLGIFLGGFVYSISSIVFMQELPDDELVVSAAVAWIYAIGSVIYFTEFVYQVSNYVQVEKLVDRMYKSAEGVVNENIDYFNGKLRLEKLPDLQTNYQYTIRSENNAYIERIHFEDLADVCRRYKGTCKFTIQTGAFLSKEKPIATFYTNQQIEDETHFNHQVNQTIVYESQRSPYFDSSYSRNKMNEVALKAISPAVNDPNTAIHMLHYKSLIEAKFASMYGRYLVVGETKEDLNEQSPFSDYCGTVLYEYNDFSTTLHVGYRQLVHYMKDDISCVEAIFDALMVIAHAAHENKLEYIKDYSRYVYQSTYEQYTLPFDRKIIEDRHRTILNIKADERKGY